ncbi:hypothetical protein B0H12DRAFT_1074109 [Mycena haematopus]|nr:hypothetical protein B0H12DRAFT_1074109 [Mycena haematopus]
MASSTTTEFDYLLPPLFILIVTSSSSGTVGPVIVNAFRTKTEDIGPSASSNTTAESFLGSYASIGGQEPLDLDTDDRMNTVDEGAPGYRRVRFKFKMKLIVSPHSSHVQGPGILKRSVSRSKSKTRESPPLKALGKKNSKSYLPLTKTRSSALLADTSPFDMPQVKNIHGKGSFTWYTSDQVTMVEPPKPGPNHSVHAGDLFLNTRDGQTRVWIRSPSNQGWRSIEEGHTRSFGNAKKMLCIRAGKPEWISATTIYAIIALGTSKQPIQRENISLNVTEQYSETTIPQKAGAGEVQIPIKMIRPRQGIGKCCIEFDGRRDKPPYPWLSTMNQEQLKMGTLSTNMVQDARFECFLLIPLVNDPQFVVLSLVSVPAVVVERGFLDNPIVRIATVVGAPACTPLAPPYVVALQRRAIEVKSKLTHSIEFRVEAIKLPLQLFDTLFKVAIFSLQCVGSFLPLAEMNIFFCESYAKEVNNNNPEF